MANKLNPFSGRQFEDANGVPYNGGKLFVYSAGTPNKVTVYKDLAGGSAHANPIILNSRGEPADGAGASQAIWQPEGTVVKLVLASSSDTDPPATPISTWDNISGINDASITSSNWTSGPTPTFVSATSFTVAGDETINLHPGRRIQSTNTGGTIYSTIITSVFTTLTTVTVINDSGVLDSGLSAVSYALEPAQNPSVPEDSWGRSITITPGSDADVTLAESQYTFSTLVLTDGSWTTSRNIIVPDDKRRYYIDNSSGTYTATIKTSGGTGIAVQPGFRHVLWCNGTNVVDQHNVDIAGTTEEASIATADSVLVYDTSAGANRKATVGNIVSSAPGASWVYLSTTTASNDAVVDITSNIDGTYDGYIIKIYNLDSVSNSNLYLQVTKSGTPDSSASYAWERREGLNNATQALYGVLGDTKFIIASNTNVAASTASINGEVRFYTPADTTYAKSFDAQFTYQNAGTSYINLQFGGTHENATANDGVRFSMATGNISSGKFVLYGLKGA